MQRSLVRISTRTPSPTRGGSLLVAARGRPSATLVLPVRVRKRSPASSEDELSVSRPRSCRLSGAPERITHLDERVSTSRSRERSDWFSETSRRTPFAAPTRRMTMGFCAGHRLRLVSEDETPIDRTSRGTATALARLALRVHDRGARVRQHSVVRRRPSRALRADQRVRLGFLRHERLLPERVPAGHRLSLRLLLRKIVWYLPAKRSTGAGPGHLLSLRSRARHHRGSRRVPR